MLSEKEKLEIEEENRQFPYRKAACLEALKIVQQHRRWVSDENIKDIAAFLNMTAEEVDNVATFYNLVFRKPVGRHVILLCDSISCWIMGYDNVLAYLGKKLGIQLGETTADGRFTLLTVPCLGTCDRAPAMMIDDDLHQDLTIERIDAILQKYN
jgi:NADH-quinone oxidoreductase subunit E